MPRDSRLALAITLLFACGDNRGSAAIDAPAIPDATAVDTAPDADSTAPAIVSTAPVDGDDDIPLDTAITVTFSEPVDPATVDATSFTVQRGGVAIAGATSTAGSVARFVPAAPLDVAAPYRVTVTTGVADPAGNHLAADAAFQFTSRHRRRAFVTSTFGNGNLATWPDAGGKSGLAGGDEICRTRALAAGLTGTYAAWLSTSTDDAFCRVQGLAGTRAANCGQTIPPAVAGPWMRVDGQPWGDSLDELLAAAAPRVFTPIALDEHGQPTQALFFSSTAADGTATVATCGDWTSSTGGVGYGGSRVTGTLWTQWGSTLCSSAAHLLCLEVGAGPAPVFPAVTGKRAFVTSSAVTGNLGASPDAGGATGLAAGDAICRTRAAAAGLANAAGFKAWLSSTAVSAASRLVSDGPWVRLDGIPLAVSKADLVDGLLATTLNLTETGVYLPAALAWTGTFYDGTTLGATCTDWTGSGGAYVGRSDDAHKWTFSAFVADCATPARLYCLED